MHWEQALIDPDRLHLPQICERVRELIHDGALRPGEKLPPTQDLARLLGTHAPTVHAAMRQLVCEGLLVRQRKHGTFVREREQKLTRVAVYLEKNIDTPAEGPFILAQLKALRAVLAGKGIAADVWVDPRPPAQQAAPWPELVQAAQQRRMQAIILPITHLDLLEWVCKLPVPVAYAGRANRPHELHEDLPQLVELSLQALMRQRCRSVGLITTTRPDFPGYYEFFASFVEVAGRLGLAIRDEWIRVRQEKLMDVPAMEAFGYREFQNLWRQAKRPDGLLVYPHGASRGVIMGLLESQARVPQELKVVLHKTAGVELFCPVPVTLALTDEVEQAELLVGLVEKQFRGEPVAPVRWSVRLARNDVGAARRPNGRGIPKRSETNWETRKELDR